MKKRIVYLFGLLCFIAALSVFWTSGIGTLIFNQARWLFIGAVIAGNAAGITLAALKVKRHLEISGSHDARHSLASTIEHWGVASGIFILILSGASILSHKGFSGTNLHFLGLFLTFLFGTLFFTDFLLSRKYTTLLPDMRDIVDGTLKKYFLRVKFKENGKYLSSQKASFLAFIVLGGQILISGVVKLLPFYSSIPSEIVTTATLVHDLSAGLFVMMLVVHVSIVVMIPQNRALLRSWFTGKNPENPGNRPIALPVRRVQSPVTNIQISPDTALIPIQIQQKVGVQPISDDLLKLFAEFLQEEGYDNGWK
jgi:cytochrome b subunit of formate dehydrogenase